MSQKKKLHNVSGSIRKGLEEGWITDGRLEHAIALRKDGLGITEIGEKIDVPHTQLSHVAHCFAPQEWKDEQAAKGRRPYENSDGVPLILEALAIVTEWGRVHTSLPAAPRGRGIPA